jgi:broad specificity phosphatase PhoE
MKRIYFVRHGETNFNINKENNESLMYQPLDDPLNSNGIDQSRKTGIYFKNRQNENNEKIDFIISSPALRAKQTAEIIANELNFKQPIIYEEKISEIKLNEKYRNLKKHDFEKLKETDENVKNFYKFNEDKNNIKYPIEKNEFLMKHEIKRLNDVYEGSESITNRLNDFAETIKALPGKNIIIITHGGIIKWITKILCNIIGYDKYNCYLINNKSNCGITSFVIMNNTFYLVSANSNKHIKYIK